MSNNPPKPPLMLTAESWSDMQARSTRQNSHERAQQPNSVENQQQQRHMTAMQELRNKGGVSKRPFFWAQGGSADMFSQAVARNMVAISKEKQNPLKKPGPGPLLTPNQQIGQQMMQHRVNAIQTYQQSIASTTEQQQIYADQVRRTQRDLANYNEQMANASPPQLQQLTQLRQMDQENLPGQQESLNNASKELHLLRDKLEATQRTEISWPGHGKWNAFSKKMREEPSKLLTLGHGNVQQGVVSEELNATQESQLHSFDTIVQSQIDSGLPLDHTSKRLDACHATAKPLKQATVGALQQLETQKPIPREDRNAFLASSSSAQQLSQAYQDKGVLQPQVKGADTTVARFPNSLPNPTYRNQVELPGNQRALRREHTATHGPVFKQPPNQND